MKFNIISDLHIDVETYEHKIPKEVDHCLIAGDISSNVEISESYCNNLFIKHYRNIDVSMIKGNHEFYGSGIKPVGIYCNSELLKDNILLIGSILWTDFSLYGTKDLSKHLARNGINDFKRIKYKGHKITPNDIEQLFKSSFNELKNIVEKNKDKKIVIMTHFAPCGKSIPEKYLNDPLNPYYCTELSEFILDNPQIRLWVSGHIHSSSDYMIGDCRVICNPKGYGNENKGFNPNLIMEV